MSSQTENHPILCEMEGIVVIERPVHRKLSIKFYNASMNLDNTEPIHMKACIQARRRQKRGTLDWYCIVSIYTAYLPIFDIGLSNCRMIDCCLHWSIQADSYAEKVNVTWNGAHSCILSFIIVNTSIQLVSNRMIFIYD